MKNNTQNSPTSDLRPIHYLGSKLRILDTIEQAIDMVNPEHGRVCDLFSGSGTVSRHLGYTRPVTAVDIQEYSRILCSAVLKPVDIPLSASVFINKIMRSNEYTTLRKAFEPLLDYEQKAINEASTGRIDALYEIIESGSIVIAQKTPLLISGDLATAMRETLTRLNGMGLEDCKMTMVTRYFGGLYFSYEQAICIDASLEFISNFAEGKTAAQDVMLAAVISATSEIVNTVGKQFAQPLQVRGRDGKLKRNLLKKILSDRSQSYFESFTNWLLSYEAIEPTPYNTHEVWRMDYQDALKRLRKSDIAVVYADPPYTRYHYSRYYHVLETICLRDNPEISTTFPGGKQLSRGIYRKERHQSPFCIQSKAGEAFDELFAGVAELGVPFVLSYSPFSTSSLCTPRMQTIDQLTEKAYLFYERVDVVSPGHFVHSKLNSTENNFASEQEAERLIICQNVKKRG